MSIYPAPLEKLIEHFTRLPGIGQKSATRMAFYIMRSPKVLAEELARSLMEVKDKIKLCSVCCNLTDQDTCAVCSNPARATGTLCVVETPGDQMALEESGVFRGRYHILHGVLSPLDGVGPEQLRIGELLRRIDSEAVQEVILATNPTTEGEATASYLMKLIADKKGEVRVSRIALGIPMGGDLKYMDRMTLQYAMKGRVSVESS